MCAALLAGETPLDGLMVYGSSAMRWLDCLEATTRRQLSLRGVAPAAIDAEVRALRALAAGGRLNGRSPTYHRQLDAVDLAGAWPRARADGVLILRGEHDWVVGADEQAALARLVAPRGLLVDLPGLDHMLGWHPDRAASLRDYGAGQPSGATLAATLAWLDAGFPA